MQTKNIIPNQNGTFTYRLTEGDLLLSERLAEIREDGWYENSAYGYSAYEVHLMGAKAEVAVGRMYGIEVDLSDRDYGDNYDFKIKREGGSSLDVKSTSKKFGDLLVRADTNKNDFYLLTHVEGPHATEVSPLGWARQELVESGQGEIANNDGHKNYVVEYEELMNVPSNLLEYND